MRADSRLPAGFVVATTAAPETVSHVLLTGATGFFGRHVLRELLTGSNVHVTCIVRATGIATARERIRAALHHTQTSDDGRVTVLCGDVGAPDLGLDEQQLRPLRNGATVVVHAAAAVDFLRPYAQLREANVTGTRNVLQLCARFGWPLHHVSSVGVFADARTGHLTRIDETIDLDDYDQPLGGYAQSKWAAEQLVRDAMHRGLHATIHRPGRLVADTRLGHSSEHDFVTAMLVLCRDLEQVPHLPGTGELRLDVTPVDHAARELVQLALTERSLGNTFHLVHPDPPKIADLLDHLRAAGWTLQEAPWSEFQQTAVQFLRRHREHLASGFLPFLQAAGSLPAGAEPRFGNARTVAVLAEHNEGRHTPQCPAITRELVALWAAQLPD